MNAPNSVTQDKRSAERQSYEPSMEEILASIRKIIADDQTFTTKPHPAKEEALKPASVAADARPSSPNGAPAWMRTADPSPAATVSPSFGPKAEDSALAREPSEDAALRPARSAPPTYDFRLQSSFGGSPVPPPAHVAPKRPEPAKSVAAIEPAGDPLVSPATDAAVSSAFNALVASRFLSSNSALSDMVREMLRPMLKAWLDDNLPILVERLVRAEIERVARGGH